MDFSTPAFVRRAPGNPVLSAKDVPYDSVQVYNAGVAKYQGKYVMVFRNDYQRTEADYRREAEAARRENRPFRTPMNVRINLGLATSDDGVRWTVAPKPCFAWESDEVERVYDPRLTVIDGRCHLCFAIDTKHGVCGGVAVTDDFERFEVLSTSAPDNRNMVLFPEKIGGLFMRLERPFPVYSRLPATEAFDVWCSRSPDARYWGDTRLLLGAERVPFANSKIGPAAPPVRTAKGWLTTFHAVWKVDRELPAWHPGWNKIYTAGLMLLDLEDPTRIVGLGRTPLIAPEAEYERFGMRGSAIFPGGMILEDDGEVKIYYGAADLVECLATAHVEELLAFCEPC